jgi:hypothetical protein
MAEFKRKQAAPVLKVTSRAFGTVNVISERDR